MRPTVALLSLLALAAPALAQPLTSAFTYQGELAVSGFPALAPVDLRFRLYDAPTGGTQIGSTLLASNVAPVNGRFAVSLDFGAAFTGARRWLEIDVSSAGAGTFTTLAGRQELAATPNASFAASAANAASLNGQAPAFYTNAGNLSSGTLPDLRLSTNIPRLAAPTNRFTGDLFTSGALGSDTGPLELRTANQRVLSASIPEQLTESPGQFSTGVRLTGGLSINSVAPGAIGSVIAGGGRISTSLGNLPNTISQPFAFIGGGFGNSVNGFNGTIAGGGGNTAGTQASVAGGTLNSASGASSAIPGGENNLAAAPYSFAAGRRAKVQAPHSGTFILADSTDADFASTAANQLLIRASAGVGINKNNPASALDVNGTVSASAFSGNGAALTAIPLANTTGTLPTARGGTNATAVGPAGSVAFSSGSAYAFSAAGTAGQFLRSAGAAAPTWAALSAADLPALAGDASGPFAATTVTALRGRPLSLVTPIPADVLTWNGATWTPAPVPPPNIPSLGGDLSGTISAATVVALRARPLSSAFPATGQVLTYNGSQWAPANLPSASVTNPSEATRLLRGIVGSSGTVITGSGFTVTRAAVGDYTINFTLGFSNTPAVTATVVEAAGVQVATLGSTTSLSCRVRIWSLAGAAVDSDFHFIAAGPP